MIKTFLQFTGSYGYYISSSDLTYSYTAVASSWLSLSSSDEESSFPLQTGKRKGKLSYSCQQQSILI